MNRPESPTPGTDTGTAPLVSAVIVNYNSWPDVSALVSALAASPEVRDGVCEVVVVDNASDGPIPSAFRPAPRGVRLILRGENGGFAVGVNAGWKAAKGRWLLLLNPDVVAGADLAAKVVGRVRSFEGDPPGIVGFGLRNADGSRQPSVGTFPDLFRAVREQFIPRSRRKYQAVWRTRAGPVAWVTGACMLVNRAVLDELDGLDEAFFLYYEEVALCRSATDRGWRVEYDPTVEVVHLRPLQDRPVGPRMRVITRHSKLLYFRKHLPRWQFLCLCAAVAAEASVLGAWASARGRSDEVRSWRAVARVVRALRAGSDLGGRDVLALADSVDGPRKAGTSRHPADPASPLAGTSAQPSQTCPTRPAS